jgi:hypothetical protein
MPRPPRDFAERFWEKVSKEGPVPAHCSEFGPCWPWTKATNEHGYGIIRPPGRRSGPALKAHRVAAMFAGLDISSQVVRHRCDNPPCCNPDHLLTGAQLDNVHDMHEPGRGNVGAVNGQAKLTDEKVWEIRTLLALGMRGDEIAAAYRISKPTVTSIKYARTWRHLTTDPVAASAIERYTLVTCLCGCGAEFTTPDKWGNNRRWLRGHARRGAAVDAALSDGDREAS